MATNRHKNAQRSEGSLMEKAQVKKFAAKSATVATLLATLFGFALPFRQAQPTKASNVAWNDGDIFVAWNREAYADQNNLTGRYDVYDPSGTFKDTFDLSPPTGNTFSAGCSFNLQSTQLYATAYSAHKILIFNDASPHSLAGTIDTGAVNSTDFPESVAFSRQNGDMFVGLSRPDPPTNTSSPTILRYDATNAYQQSYYPKVENRGADWIDVTSDGKTIYYTSEGPSIMRYDVTGSGKQLPDFKNKGLDEAFTVKLLAPYDGSGGLLVVNSQNILRLDSNGNVVQTYDVPGEDTWRALALDPDGVHFWAGEFWDGKRPAGHIYEFDVNGNGSPTNSIQTRPNGMYGMCVRRAPLTFIKSVDKDKAAVGDNLTYTLLYSNKDNYPWNNVTITDPLPPELAYVDSPDNPTVNGSTVTFNLGTVAGNSEKSVSFRAKVTSVPNNPTRTLKNTAFITATGYSQPQPSSVETQISNFKLYFDGSAWIGNKSVTVGDGLSINENALVTAGGNITPGSWIRIPNYAAPKTSLDAWALFEDRLIDRVHQTYIRLNNQLPADEQTCSTQPQHLGDLYLQWGKHIYSGVSLGGTYVPDHRSDDPYVLFLFDHGLGNGQQCHFIIDQSTHIHGTGTIISTNQNALDSWQSGQALPGGIYEINGQPQFDNATDTLGIINFGSSTGKNKNDSGVTIGPNVSSLDRIAIYSDNMNILANQTNGTEHLLMQGAGRNVTFPKVGDLTGDVHFENSSLIQSHIPPLFDSLKLPAGQEIP